MTREGDDAVAALRVNAAFYAAFADGDLAAMDELWAKQAAVLCTHPGDHTLQGRLAVMESWREIFEDGPPAIHYSDDNAVLIRGVAFVSCIERIADNRLAATNILVWEEGSWRFVHHHAGALAESAADPSGTPTSTALH
ncbi:MAG: nuclear transport factor 2 family protein [Deltaproteobacteria bacterium]|nr:nuclear transport factor 2 family protein [Deltaproteobacteria bacterium]MBW2419409.1 nuclear transport factor 2 family protein [Deltaproteobacteria bacterium]